MKRLNVGILFILFAGLAGLTWYLLANRDGKMEALTADRNFAVKDIDEVEKIFLAHRDREPVTLEKKNGVWWVNGKYKAFPNAISNLLQTIRDIRMQSIPPKGHMKAIMESMAVHGIKVEIYGEDGEKLKTYYVGGATHSEYGTYFYMDKGTQPYIMEIPSFVGNVRARYDLELRDWRDRSVFDAPVSSIEEIRVSYPDNPSESFIIRKGEQKMDLYDFANPAQKIEIKNPKNLKAYLDHFTGIGSEGIQNQNPKKDLIKSQKPYCTIQLKIIGQSDPVICRFIPIQTDTLGQLVLFPQDQTYQSGSFFRMHVDRSDGDFLLVQYPNVKPLFALRSELQSH